MKTGVAGVSRETLQQILSDALSNLGLQGVSNAQQQALLDFVDLLMKWNRVYNLTAVRDPVDMLTLHVLDSLSVQNVMRQTVTLNARLAPEQNPPTLAQTSVMGAIDTVGAVDPAKTTSVGPCTADSTLRVLDVGSGAGLPGIVLAILNPDWSITLVDAVQKKVAFMTQAIAQLKLRNALAKHGRIEQLAFAPFDAAISRAFSDLDLFASLARPHLKEKGTLCAMQGKADNRLIAPFTRNTLHRLCVPGLDAQRHLLILDHARD